MKIGVLGCLGRVGSILTQEILSDNHPELEFSGGTALSQDMKNKEFDFFVTDDPDQLFAKADAVIDFTAPKATRKHAWLAAKHKTALIVGTTGLDASDEKELEEAANEAVIVYAANMSVGVNVLLAMVEQVAQRLTTGWDIEIFESHHKHKVDAPSGTALAIGKAAAKGRNVALDEVAQYTRHGETGARKEGTIGFSVARGGDVVGDHTAYFYAEGEHIELRHTATDRSLFAKGALHAAKWTKGRTPGLYSMRDILKL